MDSLRTQSRAWGLSFSVEAFPDSYYVGRALHALFKDMENIQWIAALWTGDNTDNIPSRWECWVHFPAPLCKRDVDKLVLGWTFKSKSVDPTDIFIEKGDFVPEHIVDYCLEGSPYAQCNIPMDWKTRLADDGFLSRAKAVQKANDKKQTANVTPLPACVLHVFGPKAVVSPYPKALCSKYSACEDEASEEEEY